MAYITFIKCLKVISKSLLILLQRNLKFIAFCSSSFEPFQQNVRY